MSLSDIFLSVAQMVKDEQLTCNVVCSNESLARNKHSFGLKRTKVYSVLNSECELCLFWRFLYQKLHVIVDINTIILTYMTNRSYDYCLFINCLITL